MKQFIYIIICIMALSACTKEIDFDFHDEEPMVVIEAQVTNEGRWVTITRSRSVTDSVHSRCLPGAYITINGEDGLTTELTYDEATNRYFSPVPGEAGNTYFLNIFFEGVQYKASSTMPAATPITSSEFSWITMMGERMLCYEMWAIDQQPDVRNYFWIKMHRISHHPHLEGTRQTAPYSWDLFDDRGCPPGKIFLDWMLISEKDMDEDKEENWKRILYDGDNISVTLMTIDAKTYDYLQQLGRGQSHGANPHSNITGGCLGYFAAGSVVHTDTIVFLRNNVKEWQK